MIRRQAEGLVSHLAALLPHVTTDDAELDRLIEMWTVHLRGFEDDEIDEITDALEAVASTWDEDRLPPPVPILELVRRRRVDAHRQAVVAEARARIAAAKANPSIPSMRRTA